jgi:hypothetical protein
MTAKRWNNRALTSLLTLWGFLIMSVTGIVLFVVPQGRIAYWTEWTFLALTKEQWGDIHVLGMFLFLGAGIAHLYFNWRPLMSYLKNRARTRFALRAELGAASALSLLLIASGIWHVPPLSYVLDANAAVKEAWVGSPDDEPPFGHAELLSLKVFCKKTHIPLGAAMTALEAAGVREAGAGKALVDIARANDLSPRDLYLIIEHLQVPPAAAPPAEDVGMTAEYVEETFAGSGIGRKTLADIAGQLDLEVATLQARLGAKGLAFVPEESVKQIASRNDIVAPVEVLKAALVEGYSPRR